MSYSYYTNILGILENQNDVGISNNSGYVLILYEIKNDSVNQIFSSQLEHSSICQNLLFFESMVSDLQFTTIETNCIKYWTFVNGKVMLNNKIHVKNDITDSSVSKLNSLLLFVDAYGRGIVVNQKGHMLINFSHESESFSCVYTDDNNAYFGCQSGALCIYQLNTFE